MWSDTPVSSLPCLLPNGREHLAVDDVDDLAGQPREERVQPRIELDEPPAEQPADELLAGAARSVWHFMTGRPQLRRDRRGAALAADCAHPARDGRVRRRRGPRRSSTAPTRWSRPPTPSAISSAAIPAESSS